MSSKKPSSKGTTPGTSAADKAAAVAAAVAARAVPSDFEPAHWACADCRHKNLESSQVACGRCHAIRKGRGAVRKRLLNA